MAAPTATTAPRPSAATLITHGQFRIGGRWTKPCYQVLAANGSSQWFSSKAKAEQALIVRGGSN